MLVVVGKGQVEDVAGAHEVGAVALDQVMEAFRRQREDVEGVSQRVEVEDVGGPAVCVGGGGEVFAVFDLELGLAGEVVGALGFGEAGEAGAGVDEVGEDVVGDFDRERVEGGLGLDLTCNMHRVRDGSVGELTRLDVKWLCLCLVDCVQGMHVQERVWW